MAHKKGVGSSDNGRDSISKRLGVKLFGGQYAKAGNIIIRQRGTKYHLGEHVYMGRDHTIHAKVEGKVVFHKGFKNRTFVGIAPSEAALEELARNAAAGGSKVKKEKPAKKEAKKAFKAEKQVLAKGTGKKKKFEDTKAEKAPKVEETPVAEVSKIADIPADTSKADAAAKADADAAAKAKADADAKAKADADAKAKADADAKAKADADADAAAKKEEPVAKAKDDLTKIEGIGPKIQDILVKNGLDTYEDLANCKAKGLKMILEAEGSRYQMHDPTTWPAQARMAADGKWDELKKWQDELDGGKGAAAEEPAKKDDLTKIEGIGPKIQEKLNESGIHTFKQLADSDEAKLNKILEDAGSRFQMHNPATWPAQAKMAANGKWDELKKWQDELDGGVGAKAKKEPKAKKPKAAPKKKSDKDDLRKIEGIGPKIQEKLNEDGIFLFSELAAASQETLQAILDKAGSRYKMHNPSTWPEQSALAAEGKWEELKKLQDELDGGRKK